MERKHKEEKRKYRKGKTLKKEGENIKKEYKVGEKINLVFIYLILFFFINRTNILIKFQQ